MSGAHCSWWTPAHPPHPEEDRVLTGHEAVVIGIRETGKVGGQVIHFDPSAHNLFEPRQGLQGLIADIVCSEAVQQKQQEFPAGRGWLRQAEHEGQQEDRQFPCHATRSLPQPRMQRLQLFCLLGAGPWLLAFLSQVHFQNLKVQHPLLKTSRLTLY